jgi:hypothetical protein
MKRNFQLIQTSHMLRLAVCQSPKPLSTLIEIPQVARSRGYELDKAHAQALAVLRGIASRAIEDTL